jgi:hypothetical protein
MTQRDKSWLSLVRALELRCYLLGATMPVPPEVTAQILAGYRTLAIKPVYLRGYENAVKANGKRSREPTNV